MNKSKKAYRAVMVLIEPVTIPKTVLARMILKVSFIA